jgi:hypothetical protein
VELSPFHARLNGAPVTAGARLNLGVPGYEYAIQASADAVPVRPLANSFVAAVKDRIEGTVDAAVDIRGAGVTGTSLQKSLAGGMQFGITNANLKLDTGSRGVMSILTGLLATALNIRELRDQPIMEIGADVGFGEGAIQLRHAAFRSASLGAQVQGAIPIADDLMQSRLELPVHLELSRDLARRARLVGADEATNLTYVPLPEIASLKGTLGEPKPDVDKVKTGLLVARGVGGLVGGAAGDTIQGVTGIIGGVAKGETNSVKNLIQGIGGLFGGSRTNAQATNAPGESVNPTNASPPKSEGRSPLGGLIRGILDGQKNEERP